MIRSGEAKHEVQNLRNQVEELQAQRTTLENVVMGIVDQLQETKYERDLLLLQNDQLNALLANQTPAPAQANQAASAPPPDQEIHAPEEEPGGKSELPFGLISTVASR